MKKLLFATLLALTAFVVQNSQAETTYAFLARTLGQEHKSRCAESVSGCGLEQSNQTKR